MSKEKLEVGDIWESTRRDKTRIYITRLDTLIHCITSNGIGSSRYYSKFEVRYKYIGKSKNSIKNLFEVQHD